MRKHKIMIRDESKPHKLSQVRAAIMSAPLSLAGLIALAPLTAACEEEQQVRPQRRAIVRPKPRVSKIPNAVDLTKYGKSGNGPMKAPDWISSQDFSLMRRYSLNAPTGFRNGNEFSPKGIWVERREAGWFLIMNEEALDFSTQTTMRGERVELPLSGEPSAQYRAQVETAKSDAAWRIPSSAIP